MTFTQSDDYLLGKTVIWTKGIAETRKLIVRARRCGSAVRLDQGDSPMADQRNSGKLLKLFFKENTFDEIRSIHVDKWNIHNDKFTGKTGGLRRRLQCHLPAPSSSHQNDLNSVWIICTEQTSSHRTKREKRRFIEFPLIRPTAKTEYSVCCSPPISTNHDIVFLLDSIFIVFHFPDATGWHCSNEKNE
jgi:hypothetical protein